MRCILFVSVMLTGGLLRWPTPTATTLAPQVRLPDWFGVIVLGPGQIRELADS